MPSSDTTSAAAAAPVRRKRPRPADAAWLSPKEAAAHLGLGVDAIYDACASRGLRSVKLGHSTIRIRREWLDDWMLAQAQN